MGLITFAGTSPTQEQVEQMYEMMRHATYPYNEDNDWPLTPLNWIAKKNDLGKFSISCTIFGKVFTDFLCDTGSCINIIPKATTDRVGLTIYRESNVSPSMANTTEVPVLGKVLTIRIRIGNHIIRTDFHVVDTRGDQSASIILGRPFLATIGAVIDLPRKRVTFTNIIPFCIYPSVPTEFTLHEPSLDSNPKRKPKSRRKRDYKGKKAVADGVPGFNPNSKAGSVQLCAGYRTQGPRLHCQAAELIELRRKGVRVSKDFATDVAGL